MAYCCLILLGKSIQKIVFGELRISEQQVSHGVMCDVKNEIYSISLIYFCSQHMKDKFWNFIFYKFIFVFGIVNVQYLHEIILWVSWFSALGFLHIMAQLCKDRFEYVSWTTCLVSRARSGRTWRAWYLNSIKIKQKIQSWLEREGESIEFSFPHKFIGISQGRRSCSTEKNQRIACWFQK